MEVFYFKYNSVSAVRLSWNESNALLSIPTSHLSLWPSLRSTSYDDKKEPFHTISYELHPYMSPSMLVLLINFMLLLLFCNLSNGIFGIFTMVVIILLFCLLIELGYSSNPKQNFANSLQTHSTSFYNFTFVIVV